jgi:hypothetical protein
LREAVNAMGGQSVLDEVDDLVQANEEYTVDWFDARWDDLAAGELIEWSIATLVKTGPTVAHAALDVTLRTYPVDDDAEDAASSGATSVTAFIRVVLAPQVRADRYELDFRDLRDWIRHDAIRFVDDPNSEAPPE